MDCGSPWRDEDIESFLSPEWSVVALMRKDLGLDVSTPIFSPVLASQLTRMTPMQTTWRLSQADSGFGSTLAGDCDDDSDYSNQLSPGSCSTVSAGRDSVRRVLQFDATSVCQKLPAVDEVSLASAGKIRWLISSWSVL